MMHADRTDDTRRFVLELAQDATDSKMMVVFAMATAALGSGLEVGIFVKSTEDTAPGPVRCHAPTTDFMEGFVADGGLIWTDAANAIGEDELSSIYPGDCPHPSIQDWMADGASVVSLLKRGRYTLDEVVDQRAVA
jgi:hypothetical protein